MNMEIEELDFEKGNGLLPAIIQHAKNYRVLMLGYMDREALQVTLESKKITFYSRTKERLWTKGETSGNYLKLVDIQSDCDNDTLLILANPEGPVCHTGEKSCFFEKEFISTAENLAFLGYLENLILRRKAERPEGSYTGKLFQGGIDKIVQKVGEEAVETVIDAKNDDLDKFKNEVSDLVYHLMVLLAEKEVTLKQISELLEKRHGSKIGD